MTKQIKTTLLVTYKDSVLDIAHSNCTDNIECNCKTKLRKVGVEILKFDTEAEALQAKAQIEQNEDVLAVEFDIQAMVTADIKALNDADSRVWHLHPNEYNPNDNYHSSKLINMKIPESNPAVIIAIVDGHFFTQHEDLQGKLVDGFDATTRTLESQGAKMYNPEASYLNHGTTMAGIAVMKSNNAKAGASIGGMFNNVKALPIRISKDDGTLYISDAIVGIDHAVARKVDVISMSWGTPTNSFSLELATVRAKDAGIAMFGARSNDGDSSPFYPANYYNVMSVSNIKQNMTLDPSSSFGGVKYAGNGTLVHTLGHRNGFGSWGITGEGGTSSATPHVASIFAAIKAVHPGISHQLATILMDMFAFKGTEGVEKVGAGYPNAVESIRTARILSSEFTQTSEEINQPLDKEWTITLSKDVDPNTLMGVYILKASDSKEHPVTVKVNPLDKKQVIVTPTVNYAPGMGYNLIVADLVSTTGEVLKGTRLIFKTI